MEIKSPCVYLYNGYCFNASLDGKCEDMQNCSFYIKRTCENCSLVDNDTCEHFLC